MGIRSYIRDRKQVRASRATESGVPNIDYESALGDWGKPSAEHIKKMDEAYEKHMSDSRAKRDAEIAEKEASKKADDEAASLRRQTRPKPDHSGSERMRYLGDD
jgi:hypothetical protein